MKATITTLGFVLALNVCAEDVPMDCHPNGIAFGGLDVTTYFGEDDVRLGNAAYSIDFDGLTFHFESVANRDAFQAEPKLYVPAYDGWCAMTLSMGRLTCPDFTNYWVDDGKLYLFETTAFTNGRTFWLEDPVANRGRADANFEVLRSSYR